MDAWMGVVAGSGNLLQTNGGFELEFPSLTVDVTAAIPYVGPTTVASSGRTRWVCAGGRGRHPGGPSTVALIALPTKIPSLDLRKNVNGRSTGVHT